MSTFGNQTSSFKNKGMYSFLILLLALFIYSPGITLLITIGFLPTLGARISDPTPQQAQTFCVGFGNMAGIFPSFFEFYEKNFTLKAAYGIIHDPYNLLCILFGAALGWAIFFTVPAITVGAHRAKDKRNLLHMIKRYDKLKESWGESIPDSEIIEKVNRLGE